MWCHIQGVMLQSSYHGVHQVSGVRALSPAYQCGKLHEGDELIQVNYQTVVSHYYHLLAPFQEKMQKCRCCGLTVIRQVVLPVLYRIVGPQIGWSPLKVTAVMLEFPVEVILTVKKRPRHANTVTQIYLKPMRLPSKKRTYSPWSNTLITSLQSIPNLNLQLSV